MADPTPTRAEVEVFSPHVGWDAVPTMKLDTDIGRWVRLSDYADLRERAEAAEADLDREMGVRDAAIEMLTAARRAEAAAWNDAIEAAADMMSTCCEGKWASFGFEMVDRIRALRRAAPTEYRCATCGGDCGQC